MDKKKKRPGSRRLGREIAFQTLYSINFGEKIDPVLAKRAYKNFFEDRKQTPYDVKGHEFARELIEGTLQNLRVLDVTIDKFSTNWKIERIGKIEITLLRLAIYEMLFRDDVPIKVAIDEAVELAKKFGDINSRKFINGILDAVGKAIISGTINPGNAGEKHNG